MLRQAWERVSIYLPVILMGLLALGTYWLVRNTPGLASPDVAVALTHDPDYFMRGFSVKTFDALGRLKSEIYGAEAQHFPDTDTLEIDQVRIRSVNPQGQVTTVTADRGLSNGDGTEVQLFGHAVVVREAKSDSADQAQPRLEFRSEFLHAYLEVERVRTHKAVTITRGRDQFTADSLDYDNLERVMQLQGRVHGVLLPNTAP